jgi:sugar lactone lactonase YvrE
MEVSMSRVSLTAARCLGAVGLGLATIWAANAQEQPGENGAVIHTFPGDLVYPESVAVDPASGRFYVGSVKHGTLFRGELGKGAMEPISPAGADGREMATGIFFANGRLAVVGRQTGKMFIYDATTSKLLASFHNGLSGAENTFLNDVTFAPDGSAFVTDSVNPVLYRMVPDGGDKYRLEEYVRWNVQQLGWVRAPGAAGINFNGLVVTPDGKYLIISKRNDSGLYRFEIATKEITKVQLPDKAVFTQDGLFIDGRTVYAAQNTPESVSILDFAADYASAAKRGEVKHPSFRFPTSVAKIRDRLLVVSAQFDTKGSPAAVSGDTPPKQPFWATELPAPR